MNRKTVFASIFVAILMLAVPFAAFGSEDRSSDAVKWDGGTSTDYAGGDGTEESPYEISTGGQLKYLSDQVNKGSDYDKYFILTDDLDMGNKEWTPIGNGDRKPVSSIVFSGTFDGNGHTISNLKCTIFSSPDSSNEDVLESTAGLFGILSGAEVKNLTLKDVTVSGENNAGALAGYVTNGSIISGVDVIGGTVSGYTGIGGIAGRLYGGTITDCSNSATITGTIPDASTAAGTPDIYTHVGGIVGLVSGSAASVNNLVTFCLSTGGVTAGVQGDPANISYVNAGGIAGSVQGGVNTVQFCKSTSAVSSSGSDKSQDSAGGIVGQMNAKGSSAANSVYGCYYSGDAAKLIGSTTGTVTGSYRNGDTPSETGVTAIGDNKAVTFSNKNSTFGIPTSLSVNATIMIFEDMYSDEAGSSTFNTTVCTNSPDVTVKGFGTNTEAFKITGAKDVTVSGCEFIGIEVPKADKAGFGAITIYYSTGKIDVNTNIIDGVNQKDGLFGLGVMVQGQSSNTNNVSVEYNTISDVQFNAIQINHVGVKVSIIGNTVSNWDSDEDGTQMGRAVRSDGYTSMTVTGNMFSKEYDSSKTYDYANVMKLTTKTSVSYDISENVFEDKKVKDRLPDVKFESDTVRDVWIEKDHTLRESPDDIRAGTHYFISGDLTVNAELKIVSGAVLAIDGGTLRGGNEGAVVLEGTGTIAVTGDVRISDVTINANSSPGTGAITVGADGTTLKLDKVEIFQSGNGGNEDYTYGILVPQVDNVSSYDDVKITLRESKIEFNHETKGVPDADYVRGVAFLRHTSGSSLEIHGSEIIATKKVGDKIVYPAYSAAIRSYQNGDEGTLTVIVDKLGEKRTVFSGFAYAVNMSGGIGDSEKTGKPLLVFTMRNTDIDGWNMFNVWGDNGLYNLSNCTYTSVNPYSGPSNGFDAIVFSCDRYPSNQDGGQSAKYNVMNIKNCDFIISSTGEAKQGIVSIREATNEVNISDSNVKIDQFKMFYNVASDSYLNFSGVKIKTDGAEGFTNLKMQAKVMADGKPVYFAGGVAEYGYLNLDSALDEWGEELKSGDALTLPVKLIVCNDSTLDRNITIGTFTVGETTVVNELIVENGAKLTVPGEITITNNGLVVLFGKIDGAGTITGAGDVKYGVTFNISPKDSTVVLKNADGSDVKMYGDNSYLLDSGTYTYTISKSGYVTVSGTLNMGNESQSVSRTLSPVSSGSDSETITNPDGSVTEKKTEVVTNPDGSRTEKKTENTTNTDGSRIEKEQSVTVGTDGSKTEKSAERTKDPDGNITGSVEKVKMEDKSTGVSTEAVKNTDSSGNTVSESRTNIPAVTDKDNGNAITSVTADSLAKAVEHVKSVSDTGTKAVIVIDGTASTPEGVNGAKVSIPVSSVKSVLGDTSAEISVKTDIGNITLSRDVLNSMSGNDGDSMDIAVKNVKADELTDAQKAKAGNNPVFNFSAAVGDKNMHDLGGKVGITLPYELAEGQDPNSVKVYYLDDNGSVKKFDCKYDQSSKTVSFETDHFSYFVLTQDDLSENNTLMIVALVILAIIAAAAVILFVRSRQGSKQ